MYPVSSIKLTFIIVIVCSVSYIVTAKTAAEKDLTYTQNELSALEQFKQRVLSRLPSNYMRTDLYLIRWLRVKNLNVAQAETMLLQHLRWRQQNDLDKIQQENWTDMEEDFPYEMNTHDLEGKPVGCVDIFEGWDIRRTVIQGRTHRLLRYLYRLLEDVTGQIFDAQENGQNVTRFVILANADGFNLVQHACSLCLPVWVQFVQTFEAHYPEFLNEFIAIQSPGTVNVILDLIRPILSQETQKALKIFGHKREKWMSYLDERISRDQRTAAYGGTKQS